MSSNCGEDFWESIEQQGDQASWSYRKSVLIINWKDWCGSWSFNTLATWCKALIHWKNPDAGNDWRQEKKGITEDELIGWHHWLNGNESEQAPGVGDGQGSLACCSPWYTKSQTRLNKWTGLYLVWLHLYFSYLPFVVILSPFVVEIVFILFLGSLQRKLSHI